MRRYSEKGYDQDHMTLAPDDFAADLPRRRQSFADREGIFVVGQRATRMYFVETGCVRLLRALPDGTRAVMHSAASGEWVAESSLYSDFYHCDAVADGASTLSSLSKAALLRLFEAEPHRCLHFSRFLALRLRDLRAMHEIVRMRKAEDRVLHWLHLHASGEPPVVHLRQSWSQVAEDLGLTREALYRTISALKKSRAIVATKEIVQLAPDRRLSRVK
jgi:CRP/FNR family transcriptional regulator, dissimilatory nitrate respiration regulator